MDMREQGALWLAQGNRLAMDGAYEQALACYQEAICFFAPTPELLVNMGGCCFECNRLEEGLTYTRAALALAPEFAKGWLHFGIYCLLKGQAEPGWAGLAYRKRLVPPPMIAPPPVPAWQGEALNGQRIMLIREQGLGDVIQFSRYAKRVAERGGQVSLDVLPPLRRLFAAQTGFGAIPSAGESVVINRYAYFMDLPAIFGDSPHGPDSAVPAEPYIRLPATHPPVRLPEVPGGGLRVGLAWAGNPDHGRDKLRSLDLDRLAPVLTQTGCQFFSLLPGKPSEPHPQVAVAPLPVEDFLDLARVMAGMDLILTVDTAVAHLAGAMGLPVWLLLPTPCDWRWGRAGERTAWYPSVQLFRQPKPGDWNAVMTSVCVALATRVAHAQRHRSLGLGA